jgi:hypothetical protein
MTKKPTYKELEQRVKELEKKIAVLKGSERTISHFLLKTFLKKPHIKVTAQRVSLKMRSPI